MMGRRRTRVKSSALHVTKLAIMQVNVQEGRNEKGRHMLHHQQRLKSLIMSSHGLLVFLALGLEVPSLRIVIHGLWIVVHVAI